MADDVVGLVQSSLRLVFSCLAGLLRKVFIGYGPASELYPSALATSRSSKVA